MVSRFVQISHRGGNVVQGLVKVREALFWLTVGAEILLSLHSLNQFKSCLPCMVSGWYSCSPNSNSLSLLPFNDHAILNYLVILISYKIFTNLFILVWEESNYFRRKKYR
jgi:hypothetical protein